VCVCVHACVRAHGCVHVNISYWILGASIHGLIYKPLDKM